MVYGIWPRRLSLYLLYGKGNKMSINFTCGLNTKRARQTYQTLYKQMSEKDKRSESWRIDYAMSAGFRVCWATLHDITAEEAKEDLMQEIEE